MFAFMFVRVSVLVFSILNLLTLVKKLSMYCDVPGCRHGRRGRRPAHRLPPELTVKLAAGVLSEEVLNCYLQIFLCVNNVFCSHKGVRH